MLDLDNLFRLDHYVGPPPLAELCLQVICKNLDLISAKDEDGNRHLLKDVVLPHEICDKLFIEYFKSNPSENPNSFFTIFEDTCCTKLKHVKVGSLIPDSLFRILTSHKLAKLEYTYCPIIRKSCIESINQNAENLTTLIFRKSVGCIPVTLTDYYERGYVFKVPNLRVLTLEYAGIFSSKYRILLNGLTNLTHLDLSYSFDVGTFDFYTEVPNLVSLVLYNVNITSQAEAFVSNICNLKKLRHLDISQIHPQDGIFTNPTKLLTDIVNGLPQLTSLDISGTNLAGTKEDFENQTSKSSERYNNAVCDIPGLASRMNRPLDFLGLYGVFTDMPCTQNNIPAKLIAGTANEDQILVAVHVYMNSKEDLMSKVISDLYHMYRYENCHRTDQALCAVLTAMEKYPTQEDIQIPGSAALFYIVKMEKNDKLDKKLKKRIVGTLLTGMSIHRDEECMMRNGCLTLYQFRLPQDVRSHYESMVKLLLYLVERTAHESYVQRIGMYLLNTLACNVSGREKRLLGSLGCIKIVLKLIRYRVESEIYDYVMEIAWSILWNVTDETPINCQRFFDENGMLLFYKCVVHYSQKEDLLKNMLGLLGNLAEVQSLRAHLMHPHYMSVFTCLMRTVGLSIEIPYNAVGIFAHIASDGAGAWKCLIGIEKFNRNDVLELMAEAIERWDISSERNINYRSFEPLLRLVDVYHTPQCQHWAVWGLANLTTVYPDKYCILLIREGGYEKLETLIADPRPYERIKELARIVIENCDNYTGNNTFVKSFINDYSIYSSDGSDAEN